MVENKACAICDKEIKGWSYPFELKDAVICSECANKVNLTPLIGSKQIQLAAKDNITLQEVKRYIDESKKFDLKSLKSKGKGLLDQQQQKEQAEKEKQKQIKQAAKEKRKQEQAAIKAESVCYGMYYFDIEKRKIYFNSVFHGLEFCTDADKIVSYRVNEKGHDKTKHHTFTRAAVGAIIAGPAGAVIAGTTGGKVNEYIDELGVIINLADGSNINVNLLSAKDNKADGFIVRHAYSDLNHVIAILDGWKAQKDAEDSQITATPTDVPAEIRRYKQLLDDSLITQEEFEAKKKQLLNL